MCSARCPGGSSALWHRHSRGRATLALPTGQGSANLAANLNTAPHGPTDVSYPNLIEIKTGRGLLGGLELGFRNTPQREVPVGETC